MCNFSCFFIPFYCFFLFALPSSPFDAILPTNKILWTTDVKRYKSKTISGLEMDEYKYMYIKKILITDKEIIENHSKGKKQSLIIA